MKKYIVLNAPQGSTHYFKGKCFVSKGIRKNIRNQSMLTCTQLPTTPKFSNPCLPDAVISKIEPIPKKLTRVYPGYILLLTIDSDHVDYFKVNKNCISIFYKGDWLEMKPEYINFNLLTEI